MATQGTSSINFGATPVQSGSVVVTDATLAGLLYGEAFFMGSDSTAGNPVALHRQAGALLRVTCDAPSGTTMTVRFESLMGLVTGQFTFRYVAN